MKISDIQIRRGLSEWIFEEHQKCWKAPLTDANEGRNGLRIWGAEGNPPE